MVQTSKYPRNMKSSLNKVFLYTIVLPLIVVFNTLSAQELGYTNAYPNLTFDTPLEIVPSNDGSNRLFIVEKTGYIYQITESTGAKRLVANLTNIVTSGRDGTEIGLLGMALHPNFRSNRLFYVFYINGQQQQTREKWSFQQRNQQRIIPTTEDI